MAANNQLITLRKAPGGLSLRAKQALDVFQSTGSGLQALTNFVFPGLGTEGGGWGSLVAGWMSLAPRDFPYQNVNAYNSSIVMAVVNWITGALKEAPLKVYRYNQEGTKVELPNHRLARLLRRPNPFYSYSKLIGATSLSFNLKGNAYWIKEKADGGTGATIGFYYVPHWMITPRRPLDGSAFISHYEYNVDGKTYRVPPDRIVHFKYDIDPYNTLMGREPLLPVLTEIFVDEEAQKFLAALLRNSAVPGVIIAPDGEKVKVAKEDADLLKENFKRKFGGDNRGEPMILGFPATVTTASFNPDQMQMKDTRRLPEERVAAQFRIAPVVAGLGAGLERSTYSNYEQAERHSYESGVVPIWTEWADDMNTSLRGEFFGGDDSYALGYDISGVKALRENADAVAARNTKLWVVNGIDRAELRAATGYPVDEGRDGGVFYQDTRPAAPVNPLQAPGTAPKDSRQAKARARSFLLLKGSPEPNLNAAYGLSLEADIAEYGGRMERELEKLFTDLGEAARRSTGTVDPNNAKAEAERIFSETAKRIGIAEGVKEIFRDMGAEIGEGTRDALSLRLGVAAEEVYPEAVLNQMGNFIGSRANEYAAALEQQTREAILKAIQGAASGEDLGGIARNIEAMVQGRDMYPGIYKEAFERAKEAGATDAQAIRAGEVSARKYRANLIAVTEVKNFQNLSSLAAMEAAGVDTVYIRDGLECGWKYHEDIDLADKTYRSLEEAKRYVLLHPRCKRQIYPAKKPHPPAVTRPGETEIADL